VTLGHIRSHGCQDLLVCAAIVRHEKMRHQTGRRALIS
jgi:hypothetical protein